VRFTIPLFFLATILTGVLVPLFALLARRVGALSPVDFRRKSGARVPLFGGIPIFISFLVVCLVMEIRVGYILGLSALPILFIGIWDDLKELSALPKLLSQLLSVGIWLYFCPESQLVLEQVGLISQLAYPLTAFWIVGIINAMNMVDGMDGEATGVSIIAATSLAIISLGTGYTLTMIVFGGACAGFFCFNWPRARVYLGETGSTFLGFVLGAIAATHPLPVSRLAMIFAPLFILAVPQMDAVLAMARRWKTHRPIFKGDQDHIHHKLQKIGFTKNQSFSIIMGVCVYSGLAGIAISNFTTLTVFALVSTLSSVGMVSILGGIYYVENRLANHLTNYSKTLLHKHLKFQENFIFNPEKFFAVSFDLLTYYKELQQRGLLEVDTFVSDFSEFLGQQKENPPLQLAGAYTVIMLLDPQTNNEEFRSKICKNFYGLLGRFKIVKNSDELPLGLTFYSPKDHAHEFHFLVENQNSGDPTNPRQVG